MRHRHTRELRSLTAKVNFTLRLGQGNLYLSFPSTFLKKLVRLFSIFHFPFFLWFSLFFKKLTIFFKKINNIFKTFFLRFFWRGAWPLCTLDESYLVYSLILSMFVGNMLKFWKNKKKSQKNEKNAFFLPKIEKMEKFKKMEMFMRGASNRCGRVTEI